jgi:hypothetical protein
MNKRLINFRGTNNFAYVKARKGTTPKNVKSNMRWASCITSLKDINKPEFVDFGDTQSEEGAIFNIISAFGTLHGDRLTPTMIFFPKPCLPE